MKTLVIYYSFTGKTKKLATDKAKKDNADLIEVKKKKPYSTFGAYVFGCYGAMKQKTVDIEKIDCNFAEYDKIIIAAPIWNKFPAPPVNSIIKMLPAGKDVEFILTSGGGDSSKSAPKTKELVTKQGCTVVGYTDIRSSK
jgi:menaquinone-dependent protoporphyrinogen IX oxidase